MITINNLKTMPLAMQNPEPISTTGEFLPGRNPFHFLRDNAMNQIAEHKHRKNSWQMNEKAIQNCRYA